MFLASFVMRRNVGKWGFFGYESQRYRQRLRKRPRMTASRVLEWLAKLLTASFRQRISECCPTPSTP